jgi:hypothetical protein
MSKKAGNTETDVNEPIEVDDSDELDGDNVDDFTDTVILSETDVDDDDADETTAEINVERLIAEVEKSNEQDVARRKAIRRRLEELAEQKSLEDTYAFEFE